MAVELADVGLFKEQLGYCTNLFREFRTFRNQTDELIRRRYPVSVPVDLEYYVQGSPMQSVDLEVAVNEFTAVHQMNPTKIEYISLDRGVRAQADVDDMRIWGAASWLRQNDGRRLDKARSQSMVRYGVSVRRKHWRQVPEPEYDEMPDDMAGAVEWAEKTLGVRDRYFRGLGDHPFSSTPVSPLEMSWFPLDKPEIVFQDSLIPYIEARRLQNGKGEYVTFDKAGAIHFVGDPEPLPEYGGQSSSVGQRKSCHFVVRDYLDKKSGQWRTSELVYPDGGDLFKDGETLTEYVNPFGRSQYFVTPSGEEQLMEWDPHLRYRAKIYALCNDVIDWNTLMTLLMGLVNLKLTDERLVLNIAGVRPEMVSQLEEMGLIEGTGAKRWWTWRPSKPGTGEVSVVPGKLEAWPGDFEAHLLKLIDLTEESMRRHMPNRFLLGQAQELMKGTTATLGALAIQAARLPFGGDLTNADLDTKEDLKAEEAAICFWEKDVPEGAGKKYYLRTTGDEPVMSNPRQPGEEVYIDYEKISRPHLIFATTAGETQQEQAQDKADAYNDYKERTIDKSQLLKRLGHDDPERQLELLEQRRLEELYEPEYEQIEMAAVRTKLSALSGMNLARMAGAAGAQNGAGLSQADAGETVQPVGGQPTVRLPPVASPSGGASPMAGTFAEGVV